MELLFLFSLLKSVYVHNVSFLCISGGCRRCTNSQVLYQSACTIVDSTYIHSMNVQVSSFKIKYMCTCVPGISHSLIFLKCPTCSPRVTFDDHWIQ